MWPPIKGAGTVSGGRERQQYHMTCNSSDSQFCSGFSYTANMFDNRNDKFLLYFSVLWYHSSQVQVQLPSANTRRTGKNTTSRKI
jgi:hypothetical protein